MRIAKWISPVIVGLGLAMSAQAATAGLFERSPAIASPSRLRAGEEGRTASAGLQAGSVFTCRTSSPADRCRR